MHVEWPKLEIDTNVNSSEDDLDVNINNNDKEEQYKERPPKAHSMKAQGLSGQSCKIVIQRKQKEKLQPINLKITKHTDSARKEVYSDIPVQPSKIPPHGKSGKNPRIIPAEVRENEEALLALLEEADDLSSTTELDSDSDMIVKKHKRNRQKNAK